MQEGKKAAGAGVGMGARLQSSLAYHRARRGRTQLVATAWFAGDLYRFCI